MISATLPELGFVIYRDKLYHFVNNNIRSSGQMLFKSAMKCPAYLLESGPAAGVIAAGELAKQKDIKEIITLDIGGTTAKTALIENFEPKRTLQRNYIVHLYEISYVLYI